MGFPSGHGVVRGHQGQQLGFALRAYLELPARFGDRLRKLDPDALFTRLVMGA